MFVVQPAGGLRPGCDDEVVVGVAEERNVGGFLGRLRSSFALV